MILITAASTTLADLKRRPTITRITYWYKGRQRRINVTHDRSKHPA